MRNSDKTYGQHMIEARSMTATQEVGETLPFVMARLEEIVQECVQKTYEQGIKGKYYIHIWIAKESYASNGMRICTQCRKTRPSPYQIHDHYLWSVEDGGRVTFEWCIPPKEILTYILANPNKFDVNYVNMLRKFCADKLEKLDDYVVDGKVV